MDGKKNWARFSDWTKDKFCAEIERLEAEIASRNEEIKAFTKECERRRGGRKSQITDELVAKVTKMRDAGVTFREIAAELKISVGLAHNAYKEGKIKDGEYQIL